MIVERSLPFCSDTVALGSAYPEAVSVSPGLTGLGVTRIDGATFTLLSAEVRAPVTVKEVLKVEDLIPLGPVAYTPKVYTPRAI